MKKKILSLILALAMAVVFVPSAMAYSVLDAYRDFSAMYPEFIDVIVANGVSESTIVEFLRSIQRSLYAKNLTTPINDENFDEMLIDSVASVSNGDAFAGLQNALVKAYPDAVYEASAQKKVHPDLVPLRDTVKSMVFDYHMLDNMDMETGGVVLSIVSIESLDGVTVEKDGNLELPDTVNGHSETGVAVPLGIEWNTVPSTSKVGDFTAEGVIANMPDGYQLSPEISDAVTVDVTVTPADSGSGGNGGGSGGNGGGSGGGNGGGTGGNVTGSVTGNAEEKHLYSFSDVAVNTDLGKAVYALSDIGVINGYADGTFKPDNNITRAEIAKIMTTAMNSLDPEAKASFTDTVDHWGLMYIASAQKMGLVDGYPDGTFKPDNNITRAEAMVIIYRALDGKKVLTGNTAAPFKFSDDALVPDWAKTPIGTLANYGIVKGNTVAQPDGTLLNNIDPTGKATRGQCVTMVYNALKMMGIVK